MNSEELKQEQLNIIWAITKCKTKEELIRELNWGIDSIK